jgi:integrase
MTKASILELLKTTRSKRRFREQTGTVVKRSDGFYIRFYRDGGNGERTKVTEKLCDLSVTDSKKRKLLQRSHISSINNAHHAALRSEAPAPVLTVGAFWDATYLPWVKANKRLSTARCYEYVWKMYLKPEIETTPIDTYTTSKACELLDYMVTVKNLNKSTLHHVKSLGRGIFTMATRKDIIKINPWREAKESVKVRPAKTRIAYTPEETQNIINAVPRTDAKLFFAMVAVMGMRPSEVAASKWEHMNWKTNKYHVAEAAPYGFLGETKTKRSIRDIHVIEPALSLLKAWHQTMKETPSGLLFSNNDGKPLDHNSFAKYQILPHAKKACARWCGLYAGRHGAATSLYNLTGDVRAAYQVLGNSQQVVQQTYVKPDESVGEVGLKKYEQTLQAVKTSTNGGK